MTTARYLWALPATLLGLTLAGCALPRGRFRVVEGAIEAHGPWLRWLLTNCVPVKGGVAAMTLGHVIVGVDARALAETRAHERVHVRQYERWGGFLLPAYLLASLYAMLTGGHYYLDNHFEREARACADPR